MIVGKTAPRAAQRIEAVQEHQDDDDQYPGHRSSPSHPDSRHISMALARGTLNPEERDLLLKIVGQIVRPVIVT